MKLYKGVKHDFTYIDINRTDPDGYTLLLQSKEARATKNDWGTWPIDFGKNGDLKGPRPGHSPLKAMVTWLIEECI